MLLLGHQEENVILSAHLLGGIGYYGLYKLYSAYYLCTLCLKGFDVRLVTVDEVDGYTGFADVGSEYCA
jgi:hypothetical protein